MHLLTVQILLYFLLCLSQVTPYISQRPRPPSAPPLLIAHRGDKVLMPEHTIAAYESALIENVDFVEPDLVLTNDNVLVCFHDVSLRSGTDIASRPEFADLMVHERIIELDGKNVTFINEWFISDFDYEQLRTLRVVQKDVGIRPQFFNSMFWIPTFQEFLDTVHGHTLRSVKTHGKKAKIVGIIPELKHTKYHDMLVGTPNHMADLFLGELSQRGYAITSESSETCFHDGKGIPCSPLIVQCFDVSTIEYLSKSTDLALLALLDVSNPRYLTYKGLESLKGIAHFIGIWKELLFTGTIAELGDELYDRAEINRLGGFIPPQKLVEFAHSNDMLVSIYTIYHSDEPSLRGCAIRCLDDTKQQELEYYFRLRVDAFFIEGICESYRIRDRYFHGHKV